MALTPEQLEEVAKIQSRIEDSIFLSPIIIGAKRQGRAMHNLYRTRTGEMTASTVNDTIAYDAAGGLAGFVLGAYAATLLPLKWGFVAGIAGVAAIPLTWKAARELPAVKNSKPLMGVVAAAAAVPAGLVLIDLIRGYRSLKK